MALSSRTSLPQAQKSPTDPLKKETNPRLKNQTRVETRKLSSEKRERKKLARIKDVCRKENNNKALQLRKSGTK